MGESIWEESAFPARLRTVSLHPCRVLPQPLPPSVDSLYAKMRGLEAERLNMGWISAAKSRADVFTPSAPVLGQVANSHRGRSSSHQVSLPLSCHPLIPSPPYTNLILTLSRVKSSVAFHCPLKHTVRSGFCFSYPKRVCNSVEETGLCTNISMHGMIIIM